MRGFCLRLLPLLLIPSLAHAELIFENAWIRNLPPSVPLRAGYLSVTNPDAEAVLIVGMHGELFTRVEMHRSVIIDGTMQMKPVRELEIDAGSTLQFEPGGLHLMLHPRQPTHTGDSYRIVVELDDGGTLNFEMTVRD